MPVTQLEDNTGANLGSALGAAAGYFATQKQRKADKATATARQSASDARATQAAADTHADITSAIKDRDAGAQRIATQDLATQTSQGAYQKYLPMLSSPPTANGKPLHGPALASALQKIKVAAAQSGMTAPENVRDFDVEIAGALQRDQQANIPKISDVEHGLPQLKPGATPQQISKHYLDAASRVIQNANIPPDQQKLIAEQFQKLAAEAVKGAPAQMTPYQTQELKLRQEAIDKPPRPREGRTPSAQEQYFLKYGYMPPSYGEAHKQPGTPKEDPSLAGQVTTLRQLYEAHQYQNPKETPDQTRAWVQSQGFPPAAVMQVAPAFAGGASSGGGGGGGDTSSPAVAPMRRHITKGPHAGGIAESSDGGKTWHLSQ